MIWGYDDFRKPSHNFDYHANRLGNCSDKPISTSFQLLKEHSTSRLSPRASVKNVGTKTMISNYQLGSTTSNHVKPIAMAPVPTGKFERTKTEKLWFKKQKTNCVLTIMICVTGIPPNNSYFMGISIINHPLWGTPHVFPMDFSYFAVTK